MRLAIATLLILVASAQVRLDHSEAPAASYRVQTKMALVTFGFQGPALEPNDIRILEDGIPQEVAVLEGKKRSIPTDVILLFDCSTRFRGVLDPRAIKPHLLGDLENVRVSIYGFSDAVYRLIKPTDNMSELGKALDALAWVPKVRASEQDPIMEVMGDALSIPGAHPRMMVIFAGMLSRICDLPKEHIEDTVKMAQQNNIALFPVVVQPVEQGLMNASVSGRRAIRNPIPKEPNSMGARQFLSMAPPTGGKGFFRYAMPARIVPEVIGAMMSQAPGEYIAGYYPKGESGKRRWVEVVLTNKNVGEISGGTRMIVY